MSNQLKALHDRLLAEKPADAVHDPATCVLCAMEDQPAHKPKGGTTMGDFTQADMDAAVVAAKAELQKDIDALQAKLAELSTAAQETEVGKAVAEAVAAKETALSELQTKLDAAEAAKNTAETALSDLEAFWAKAIEDAATAEALEAKKTERLAEAKDIGVFTDEELTEKADRFAAMSDEDWADRTGEWKAIAGKKTAGAGTTTTTAFQASRQSTSDKPGSSLRLISEMRREGQDPRRTA
jgi:hypothetical protein